MIGVRVGLSSGDSFYVAAPLERVMGALLSSDDGLVTIGGRLVNPMQVTQLTYEQIPSIESPEVLHEEVT